MDLRQALIAYAMRRQMSRERRRRVARDGDLHPSAPVDDRLEGLSRIHLRLDEGDWATVPADEQPGMLWPDTAGSRARMAAWTRIERCRELLVLLVGMFAGAAVAAVEPMRIVEPVPLAAQLVPPLIAAPCAPPRRGAPLLAA